MPFYARSRSVWIGLSLAATVLSAPVGAQQTQSSNQAPSTVPQTEKEKKEKKEKLEEVIVTGTNIRLDVSEVAALPLTVVSAADIAKEGPQEIAQVLRMFPAFSGGTSNSGTGGYFSSVRTTLNLYGLGDNYTLVLVNGRRFNAVTPADIGNIPASAVSSIEILKDGGSSIYGSDAVAGVINIILNKKYEGMEVSTSYGDRVGFGSHATDSTTGLKFGVSSDRARVVANLEFRAQGGTKDIDIELGRTSNLDKRVIYSSPGNVILPNGQDVILNYHVFGPGSYSRNPADYIPYNLTDYNNTIGQVQRATLTDRQPKKDVSGFAYGEYDLTDKATLFSEIYYSAFKSSGVNKVWGVDFYGDPHLDFGPVPATNYWNPFGVALRDVYYGLPELGGVIYHGTIDTSRVVGGVKGEVGQFAYEVGATYFWEDQTDQNGNFYSDAGLYAAINRPGPDALNPFCYGCNTPTQLAGIDVSNALETISQQSIVDAKLSGPLLKRDNYDVAFAAGAETRQEKWTYSVDPLTATGDLYYEQHYADFQKRRSSAVFGELAYHLGEGAQIPAVHKLTVNVSARHEWIESVGGTTNPHLAVSWQPISAAFTLRTSYGTSFKAPPINLLRATQTIVNDYLTYPQFNNKQLPTDVILGGNPNLRPETAKTLNLGLIIAPSQLPGSSVSVDYFRVRQNEVVLVPNPQDIVNGTFPGTVDFSGARPLINAVARNAGRRNVQGVDLALNLRYATARTGTFGFKSNSVLLMQFDVNNGPGFVSELGKFENYLFQHDSPGALGSLPRLRAQGGPTWTNPSGDFNAQLTANYVEHYHDGPSTNRDVSQFLTYDFNLDADLSRFATGLSGNLGILNILSAPPPFVRGFGTTYFYYDPGLSNSLGRVGFLGLKYHF